MKINYSIIRGMGLIAFVLLMGLSGCVSVSTHRQVEPATTTTTTTTQ